MYEESLTTEILRKKFKNNFNLCNFSIQIGREMIANGQPIGLRDVLEVATRRADEERESP